MKTKSICEACGQSLDYAFDIDRGTCQTLKRIAQFIKQKGVNFVHVKKELVDASNQKLNPSAWTNLPRLVKHGLIAHVGGERGNYALTEKGLAFLSGAKVPRTVRIKKNGVGNESSKTVWHSEEEVSMAQIDKEWGPWWSANGYTIEAGRVIYAPNRQASF